MPATMKQQPASSEFVTKTELGNIVHYVMCNSDGEFRDWLLVRSERSPSGQEAPPETIEECLDTQGD